jgi:hypothetical protein
MEFYFKNWVQLSYDFGKMVPSGTTQGKVWWTTLVPFNHVLYWTVLGNIVAKGRFFY